MCQKFVYILTWLIEGVKDPFPSSTKPSYSLDHITEDKRVYLHPQSFSITNKDSMSSIGTGTRIELNPADICSQFTK